MKKPITILALALLLATPSFVSAKDDVYVPSSLDFFSEEPSKQKAILLINGIKKALQENPGEVRLYDQLVFAYDYIGEYEKEIEAAKLYIQHLPKDAESLDVIYGNLARAYLMLNKFDEAKPILDKALSFNQENVLNRGHLLRYFIAKDMYQEAAAELKTVSAKSPETDYYYDMYIFAMKTLKKDLSGLVELYRQGVKVNPDSYMAHRVLAIAIRNASKSFKDDLPLIMDEFDKSLAINSKYIPTYVAVGDTYMLLGLQTKDKRYFKDAMRWFKDAEKINRQEAHLVYALSNLLIATEQYDKAIRKLESLINQGNRDEELIDALTRAYNNKAYACYTSGKNLKGGLKTIDKALSLRPDDGMYLSTKGELLFKLGRLQEAYEYIKKGIAILPDEPEIKRDLENIEKALKKGGLL